MNRSATRGLAASATALVALVALVAVIAVTFGRADAADPSPSAPPSTPPTVTPTPTFTPTPFVTPTPIVTRSPQPSGPTGGVFEVDLDVAPPDDVSVVVTDESGAVTGASSGRAGDGMSVRWGTIEIENVDADTLRVTWVGLPGDDEVRVRVSGSPDDLRLLVVHQAPPENSDALGHDRVLLLDLSGDVSASDVRAVIRSGSDT